ncbi:hypothetical protein [Actomonas aquatica]|uniref:Lipoprotein n=1 Tax=Actomonas aquatica TaxID=2866162 RepID=A0ABZ1C9C9_9BACT|nr:hypothetical protein [Opitutus sp. WL0086]WRQ87189.1 hypothetical protein K1X11_020445 [Opitutus sp. WL0086]
MSTLARHLRPLAVTLAVLVSLPGCLNSRRPAALPIMEWGIFLIIPINWQGIPLAELNVAELGFDALAPANHDHFFPPDTHRALVSAEALSAGLFNPRQRPHAPLSGASPDGLWFTQLKRTEGLPNVIEMTRQADQDQRYFWSTGQFESLHWSPQGRWIGLNELRPNHWRHAFLVDTHDLDQASISVRSTDLTPFFTTRQLDRACSSEVQGWLTPSVLVLWVHGAPDTNGIPHWGYEVMIDATLPASADNARVLRAYQRRDEFVTSR